VNSSEKLIVQVLPVCPKGCGLVVVVGVVVVGVVVVGVVVVGVVVVGVVVVGVVVVGVVVVVPVVVDVPVEPDEVDGEVLTVVVWVEPSASLVVALAAVTLPFESTAYCAEPVPPPQAASSTETLATAVSDMARFVLALNDTLNIGDISLWLA
jgi:hypothetical protein